MTDFSKYKLGENSDDIEISSSGENRSAVLNLIEQAQRSVEIFTHNLEPRIYDDGEIISSIRKLAVNNRHSKIRILVIDPDFIIKHGHRLIELSRTLTSYIQIRKNHPEYRGSGQAFVTVDKRGYLYKPTTERYEGIVNFNAPVQATEYVDYFNDAWEHGTVLTDMRRLYI